MLGCSGCDPHGPLLDVEAGDHVSQNGLWEETRRDKSLCLTEESKLCHFSYPDSSSSFLDGDTRCHVGISTAPLRLYGPRKMSWWPISPHGQASRNTAPRLLATRSQGRTVTRPWHPAGLPAFSEARHGRNMLSYPRLLWFLVLNAMWCPKVAMVPEEAPGPGSPKDKASWMENASLESPRPS